jgi:heme/copper-type cytochrome/quinol oxidase subunit 2
MSRPAAIPIPVAHPLRAGLIGIVFLVVIAIVLLLATTLLLVAARHRRQSMS